MAKKKGKARRPPQQATRQREAAQSRHQVGKGQTARTGAAPGQPSKAQPSKAQPSKAQPSKGQPAKGQPAKGQPAKSASGPPATGQAAKGRAPSPTTKGQRPVKERSGTTRAERLAAAERARRRRALRKRAMVAGVVLVLVGAVAALVLSNRKSSEETVSRLEAGSCQFDRRADSDSGPGRNHVASPTYEVDPPAGGNHLANAAGPGVFTAENTPPDGQLVHSLEHGYVVLWHKPDLPADEQTRLRELAGKYDRDVLLVPRPSLPQPVAATAWGRRLLCGDADVAALDLFVTSFRNEGPEKVPH